MLKFRAGVMLNYCCFQGEFYMPVAIFCSVTNVGKHSCSDLF